jgi:hypothetical protein
VICHAADLVDNMDLVMLFAGAEQALEKIYSHIENIGGGDPMRLLPPC